MADYFIISKEDSAAPGAVETLTKSLKMLNPNAKIVHANSPCTIPEEDVEKVLLSC